MDNTHETVVVGSMGCWRRARVTTTNFTKNKRDSRWHCYVNTRVDIIVLYNLDENIK